MKNAKIQKLFIHYEELKYWERVVFVVYAIVTLCLASSRLFFSEGVRQTVIFMYATLTQAFLYIFLYVSLKNFRSYLIWLCFGTVHVFLYLYFKGDNDLELPNGTASGPLLNTIPLLLLFQLLRFLSREFQKRDFVVPTKGGGPDLIENKQLTAADYILFTVYMASFCGLSFLSVHY
ncbi:hypothetical protein ACRQ5D_09125 [Mucilaginibacter sp. P25]|uniref:Uncharacterized protein n=1 Tax=Mucilaginibacter gossypii TaxID=551996 RepID=A0A1G8HUW2_9SPHI|nr:hypothetical protein [Mucilaginibacter gossypii]SDI10449.1 hypothetical protein SAMN05192573_11638 [Mucilaginibacter gossypii]